MADFTFLSRESAGQSWLAVGDSAGFIDPLFSSGAHVAMIGAYRGADALHAALEAGKIDAEQLAPYVKTMKRGTHLFIGMVQSFYEGILVPYLFAEQKREYLDVCDHVDARGGRLRRGSVVERHHHEVRGEGGVRLRPMERLRPRPPRGRGRTMSQRRFAQLSF